MSSEQAKSWARLARTIFQELVTSMRYSNWLSTDMSKSIKHDGIHIINNIKQDASLDGSDGKVMVLHTQVAKFKSQFAGCFL